MYMTGRCPFLALWMQQGAAHRSKPRHKAKVENRQIPRLMKRDPAVSSTWPQTAANGSTTGTFTTYLTTWARRRCWPTSPAGCRRGYRPSDFGESVRNLLETCGREG